MAKSWSDSRKRVIVRLLQEDTYERGALIWSPSVIRGDVVNRLHESCVRIMVIRTRNSLEAGSFSIVSSHKVEI